MVIMRLIYLILLLKCGFVFGDSLSLSGNPATLSVTTATAGSQPNSVTNTSTTYNVTTTIVVRSITGNLSAAMPSGVTLKLTLAAPSGGTSAGAVALTTTAQTLVSNIPIVTVSTALAVTYSLAATVSAVPVTNATRTLTLTLQ